MAKLMEIILQGVTPTGMYLNKFNVYNNSLSGTTIASLPILETLGYDPSAPTAVKVGSILEAFQLMTPSTFEWTQFYARDIYNVNDFAQINVSGAGWQGKRAGTAEYSAFVAKLKSTRTRQDIKAGFKALPPILTNDTGTGTGALTSTVINMMTTICTRMDDGLDVYIGVGFNFFGWTIAQKEKYETESGKTAYRYFPTLEAQAERLATPVKWVPIERVSTQNSRKFGKGR